ncbi:hypothetical protein MKZ38_005312 [Zalerion maritima]|uniref:Uncharacterized protein n=1 Tax=Zalerion maritima TaxID=339359 RepID=A0AAD5RLB1_9PEZI|nr:hypothetical protein MKZ38_005312 [Zalerion maritima]
MGKSLAGSTSSDPQTFALQSLLTSSTRPTPAHADRPDHPTDGISPSLPPPRPRSDPHSASPPHQATTSIAAHGTHTGEITEGPQAGNLPGPQPLLLRGIPTAESSCADETHPSVPTMTKSNPSLLQKSSPTLSYGSLGRQTEDISEPSFSVADGRRDVSRPRTMRSNGRRSSRNNSGLDDTETTISVTKRSSRKSQDEVGGSSVVGGLEGRFGVAEAALPTDILDGAESGDASDDDSEDALLTDDGGADNASNDPPDNSPYSQVRASVPPTDNTTLSINTPRMWTLSTLFSILGSSTNLFFSLRYPSVAITPVIALLLVHPLGLLWDYFLKRPGDPQEEFIEGVRSGNSTFPNSPSSEDGVMSGVMVKRGKLEKLRLWLAQGSWNEKEHTCVYVSSNVSFGFAFATDVIVEQTQFYKQDATIVYQLLLTLSTQILGYAFAGLTRRFLVRPSGMIWPGTLMSAAMFGTLHKDENKPANGWTMTRWRFFFIVWISGCIFYFLPGLLFPALSYFNVVTWLAPKNVVVANLFGVVSGLGLFPLTFDWAQVAYIGSPLLTPFWAAMNVVGGLVIVMWIVAPIAYYKNLYFSSYMPILSSSVFDNTGKVYDVSKILTKDFVLDRDAYRNYSRVFLPITYVLSYGLQFAGLASLITHTICWHGKDILTQWKRSFKEAREETKTTYQPISNSRSETGSGRSPDFVRSGSSNLENGLEGLMSREDVHNRLMKRYKDAPLMWYLVTFISMTAIGIFVVEYYPVHLPWYGILLALGICGILFIPIGIIMAVTNQQSSIYLICQLICGVIFPGRPVANMVFVTYGYISSAQGIKFAADLKLGHYMKIPPRMLFSVQMVATIVASLTQIFVLNWMFGSVPGLCTPQAINGFTCPIARVHFNGSILWGVVGPKEFFGPGATYKHLVWCFLFGAVAPIPLWLYSKNRKPGQGRNQPFVDVVRKINLPVLFGSLSWIPPATGLNFSVWAVVCYIFNYAIKRRAGAWWAKYTMTLSAALDSGLAFGIVVVFFGFVYPGYMKGFKQFLREGILGQTSGDVWAEGTAERRRNEQYDL